MSSLELEIQRGRDAPAVARAAIDRLCERAGLTGARCHTLRLLVSEVVTNAVLHSDAPASIPILLDAGADSDRVRVAVADGGRCFTPSDAARAHGGWGLRLVGKEALRWGVDDLGGTVVWFELGIGAMGGCAGGEHHERSPVSR
jgi:anti-sigma regulatory factor (Ser/Thr protein kinase)